MALIRVVSRVDRSGRIKLPSNLRRAAGLPEGRWVEMRVTGGSQKLSIVMTPRDIARKYSSRPLRREK